MVPRKYSSSRNPVFGCLLVHLLCTYMHFMPGNQSIVTAEASTFAATQITVVVVGDLG